MHRREELYRIFSWSTSLFMAVIGILVAYDRSLTVGQKLVLTFAVGIVGLFVCDWQRQINLRRHSVLGVIAKIDEQLGFFTPGENGESIYPQSWYRFTQQPTRRMKLGLIAQNIVTLFLLVLAIVVIWWRGI